MSHSSHLKKEDYINFRPPQAHECTYICTDTIIKMDKDSFSLFLFSRSCLTLLALPAAGCLGSCSSPARLCRDVSPSPCPSLPHLSHFLTVEIFLIFLFLLLFSRLNFHCFAFLHSFPSSLDLHMCLSVTERVNGRNILAD